MTPSRFWGLVLLAGVFVVATATFAGTATTQAAFVDAELGNGSVTAATSFGGNPPGPRAYNDANGNGRYDSGEQTFTADDLTDFDDSSANLVVPSDVNTVEDRNGGVSITANSLTAETDFRSRNGGVDIEATGGDVDLNGQTARSRNGDVSISASGDVDITDATLRSRNEDITVESSGTITAERSSLRTRNGDVSLTSVGSIDPTDATLRTRNGDLTADLGTNSATLTVEGTAFVRRSGPGTLLYSPGGVTVQGTPEQGSTQPD